MWPWPDHSNGEGQEQVWPLGKSWRAWHFWPHPAVSWWNSWEGCIGEENAIHCNDIFLIESEERQCLFSCLSEVRGWCWMQCLHDQVGEGGFRGVTSALAGIPAGGEGGHGLGGQGSGA